MSIRPDHPAGYVYYIRLKTKKGTFYKLGYTKMDNVMDRYSYGGSDTYKLINKVLMHKYCLYAYDMEQKFHYLLQNNKAYPKYSRLNLFRNLSDHPLFKDGQSELYKTDVLGLDPDRPFKLFGSLKTDLVKKKKFYKPNYHKSVSQENIRKIEERDYKILYSFLVEPLLESKEEFTKRHGEWVVSFVKWAIYNAATSFDQKTTIHGAKPLPTTKSEIISLKELCPVWICVDRIPKEIGQLINLELVRFNQFGIKSIPKELYELNKLETLDLKNTGISSISKDIKKLQSLKRLDLSNTKITEIPQEIKFLTNLEELDLRNIILKSLPAEIVGLKKLKRLRVDANHWKFLYDLGMNKNIFWEQSYGQYDELELMILLKYEFVESVKDYTLMESCHSVGQKPYYYVVQKTVSYLKEQGNHNNLNQDDYVDICYGYIKFCAKNDRQSFEEKLEECGANVNSQSQDLEQSNFDKDTYPYIKYYEEEWNLVLDDIFWKNGDETLPHDLLDRIASEPPGFFYLPADLLSKCDPEDYE